MQRKEDLCTQESEAVLKSALLASYVLSADTLKNVSLFQKKKKPEECVWVARLFADVCATSSDCHDRLKLNEPHPCNCKVGKLHLEMLRFGFVIAFFLDNPGLGRRWTGLDWSR